MNRNIVFGLLITFVSIWLGGYLLSVLKDTWAGFPALATTMIFCAVGFLIATKGVNDE